MRDVADGVTLEALPNWVVTNYQRFYKSLDLRKVRIGESDTTPSNTTAITDCQKIYFPLAQGHLTEIRSQDSALNYHLLLHELAHSNQCMDLDPGAFSTKRDRYADMWFRNLPEQVMISIMTDGVPVDGAIHG